MSDIVEMQKIRNTMRSVMREFNQIINENSKGVTLTPQNEERIKEGLMILADQVAKRYRELQRKYSELMFDQDLEELVGKDKAELFLKAQALQDAAENN